MAASPQVYLSRSRSLSPSVHRRRAITLLVRAVLIAVSLLAGARLGLAQTLAGGSTHTVLLKPDGTVWTWGKNSDGQLGNGTTTQSTSPVVVSTLSNITAIAAGSYHTLALKSDLAVWSFGRNNSGQLGNNGFLNQTLPVQMLTISNAIAIAAGELHSVVLKSDGCCRSSQIDQESAVLLTEN
jgi:alpha-tubulin suppressor-like RCC1 family protein